MVKKKNEGCTTQTVQTYRAMRQPRAVRDDASYVVHKWQSTRKRRIRTHALGRGVCANRCVGSLRTEDDVVICEPDGAPLTSPCTAHHRPVRELWCESRSGAFPVNARRELTPNP